MKKRKPEVILGTPPTPGDPNPSNQVIEKRSDRGTVIRTPRPTEQVIREYHQATSDHPDDAGLRLHFAIALNRNNNLPAAIAEAKEAVRLRPDWELAHSTLGFALRESGDLDGALMHLREALRLMSASDKEPDQGDAILRWGLAGTLRDAGEVAEARKEMEGAVQLQKELLLKKAGSHQLLRQLEEELASFG